MTYNIPTFARLRNPIKLAIIRWVDDRFQQSGGSEFTFRMGDLEDGIRDILNDPNLKGATIRTHTGNLIGAKPRYIDEVAPKSLKELEEEPDCTPRQKAPYKDRSFTVSKVQMESLLAVQTDWARRYPTAQLARDSR